ncbi:MAG: hypothetical protein AAF617_14255 [Bacteroidota bacterium]
MIIFVVIAIAVGLIALFFAGAYIAKKRNEKHLDSYFDERNRNL